MLSFVLHITNKMQNALYIHDFHKMSKRLFTSNNPALDSIYYLSASS